MDTHEIQSELKTQGLNFSIIADALEVTPQHISRTASRDAYSHRVAKAIAKALGKTVAEVFPEVERYRAPPRPTKSVRRAKVTELKKTLAACA